MNQTPETPKESQYTVTLLGHDRLVDRKLFNRKEFIDPGATDILSRRHTVLFMARSPLTYMDVRLFDAEKAYNDIVKAFDSTRVVLHAPGVPLRMTAGELKDKALAEFPNAKGPGKACDLYARTHFGHPYSDLVNKAKVALEKRFRLAFSSNQLDPANHDSSFGSKTRIFSHYPIWATPDSIREFKQLAKQGHVYSQYMAGLLLATVPGNHDPECIDYLLMAHKNKHPEALGVLAEYLLYKDDYLGAVQCALISLEGGDRDSRHVIKTTFGICSMKILHLPNQTVPAIEYLLRLLTTGEFAQLFAEHCPEYAPSEEVMPSWMK